MHPSRRWRPLVPVILLSVLAGCATSTPDAVQAGAPTDPTATTVAAPVSSTALAMTTTSSATAAVPAATTPAAPGASGPSPVAGLSAADLRAAVEAPAPAPKQATSGPVAQAVRLPNGATVWRVRIPGRFPVRSARVVVAVAGHRIGEGVVGPRLGSLVAVTRSPAGLVAGATVTYQWGGSAPVVAGRLVVVR